MRKKEGKTLSPPHQTGRLPEYISVAQTQRNKRGRKKNEREGESRRRGQRRYECRTDVWEGRGPTNPSV